MKSGELIKIPFMTCYWFKRFGAHMYSGYRIGYRFLMRGKLNEPKKLKIILNKEYINGKMILYQKQNRFEKKRGTSNE